MDAYDLVLDPGKSAQSSDTQGWCFGCPPGINPGQWPLDPNSGYPLCHGFTLKLPEDYRVHGDDIVAVSFFSVAAEHNDGGPISTPGLANLILSPPQTPPGSSELFEFWTHAKNPHPKLFRMQDILGCAYAALLLTEAEYLGPVCETPEIVKNPLLRNTPPPAWIDPNHADPIWWEFYQDSLDRFGFSRQDRNGVQNPQPIAFIARKRSDPNAGKSVTDPDYESRFDVTSGTHEWKEWARNLGVCHIGGTMDAVQVTPEFSKFYVGFDEWFGGFNFGAGQLNSISNK